MYYEDFWIGSPEASWPSRYENKWCVSARTLRSVKRPKRSHERSEVVIDSGGFTELNLHGTWTVPAKQYAAEVKHWISTVGNIRWAAAQDWMCETVVLNKTGLTVKDHQELTVNSFLDLKAIDPDIPWMPVIQGFTAGEYLDCVELYDKSGINLVDEPIVGLGSVCRRQATGGIESLVEILFNMGIKLHGFGLKKTGLRKMSRWFKSSDSMAWSFKARIENLKLDDCTHRNCANCPKYAMVWAKDLIDNVKE